MTKAKQYVSERGAINRRARSSPSSSTEARGTVISSSRRGSDNQRRLQFLFSNPESGSASLLTRRTSSRQLKVKKTIP
ncbi:hypothetical protein EAE96_003510 [Botrytis aclada]|nr:hypothetical protein EAE96_003510 [Botrytis aclada]